jgi:hypothetical protein
VDVSTAAGGTISIDAEGAALTMIGDARVTATLSSVRLNAATDITVGNVVAASVSLVADGGNVINAAGSTTNVTATSLRIEAYEAIGAADRSLSTAVDTLAARSNGTQTTGIYITEQDDVVVTGVSVQVQEFTSQATLTTVVDEDMADLVALGGGDVVLHAGGTITLQDGTSDGLLDGRAVVAEGGGKVTLQSASGALVIDASISTDSGSVDLLSQDSIVWGEEAFVQSSAPAQTTQLTIKPSDPARDIIVGVSLSGTDENVWRFDPEDLDRLRAGYQAIIIGSPDHQGAILVDGTQQPVVFMAPVEILTGTDSGPVTLTGDIQAAALSVSDDGDLRIVDAHITLTEPEGLIIKGSASLSGDVTLVVTSLVFDGGEGSIRPAQTTSPTTLTILPAGVTHAIVMGSDAEAFGASLEDALLMGTRELAALADGFSRIEIGHAERSAALRIEGEANFSDAVTLWGGSVLMGAGSAISGSGDVMVLASGDVVLERIDAVGHAVTIRAEGYDARVTAGSSEPDVNVVASKVVLEGFGPVDGAAEALRVSSDRVDVFTPTGMVLRQTQTDGKVHFLVMVDGVSHLQLVNTQRDAVAAGRAEMAAVESTQGTIRSIAIERTTAPLRLSPSGLADLPQISVASKPLGSAPLGLLLAVPDALAATGMTAVTWRIQPSTDDGITADGKVRVDALLARQTILAAAAGTVSEGAYGREASSTGSAADAVRADVPPDATSDRVRQALLRPILVRALADEGEVITVDAAMAAEPDATTRATGAASSGERHHGSTDLGPVGGLDVMGQGHAGSARSEPFDADGPWTLTVGDQGLALRTERRLLDELLGTASGTLATRTNLDVRTSAGNRTPDQ